MHVVWGPFWLVLIYVLLPYACIKIVCMPCRRKALRAPQKIRTQRRRPRTTAPIAGLKDGRTVTRSQQSSASKLFSSQLHLTGLRQQQRQQDLFTRRMSVALSHPDLEDVADLLNVLGPEGMSADESDEDDEGNPLPLTTLLHPWRSVAVSEWLRTLDDVFVYEMQRTQRTHEIPDDRQRSLTPFHGSVAVRGLPHNFYRSKWLKTLNPTTTADLRIRQPAILQYSDEVEQ